MPLAPSHVIDLISHLACCLMLSFELPMQAVGGCFFFFLVLPLLDAVLSSPLDSSSPHHGT